MLTVTAAFLVEVARSHRIATAAQVMSGVTASSPGVVLNSSLRITGGTVRADVANAIRRSCDVTLVDPTGTVTPAQAGDLLSPYGNEVQLFRGVTYTDGTTETVPLGVFGIAEVKVEDAAQLLTINVVGYDRADRVARALLTDSYTIAAGTNTATGIQALIASRVPGLTYNFTTTATTLPLTVFQVGDDPWAKSLEMAKAIGCDLFFDPYGVCTLTPVTDPNVAPTVATFAEGASATLTKLSRAFTNRQTFSDVIAIGQGSGVGTPVRAQVQDLNVLSPTYYLGPYGDVVTVYNSPLLLTAAQATTAATAILNRQTGLAEQLTLAALVNPALDIFDVVQVTRARSNVNARYSIDSLTYPLSADGTLEAIVRRRTA